MGLGAVGGALGGQVVSGAIGYGLQKDQQNFNKEVLQNQKQWLVADLRAAGLNPILAAGSFGGSVSGGGGIASPSSGQDFGEAFRKGDLFKAAKAKALADAGSAKNVEERTRWEKDTALHLSTQESDNAIIKQLQRVQATAQHDSVMKGIQSRNELDNMGIKNLFGTGFDLSGAETRKLNVILRRLRGQDTTSAKE